MTRSRSHDPMQSGMAEATRLIRAGRLAEATAFIQRTLGGTPYAAPATPGNAGAPGQAEFRVVDADPPGTAKPARKSAPWGSAPANLATARPFMRQAVPPSVTPGGQFVAGRYSNHAGIRPYKLYIPSGYTGQPMPLLVMLHGCSQTADDFAAGTRMNLLAERDHFFVAYPEQPPSANGSKCWNWFQTADQQRGMGEPALLAGVTQEVMRVYRIDARRVFVAGLSSGGAMAAVMAATYPDLYAAVGVHSGLAYGAAHDLPSAFAAMQQGAKERVRPLASAIPLILFHGDQDTTVAAINAEHLMRQWLAASGSKVAPTAQVERGQSTGGRGYTRSLYRNGQGRVIVEQWRIHQAGHAWSGGSAAGSYTDPQGPNASVEMVRFFYEQC